MDLQTILGSTARSERIRPFSPSTAAMLRIRNLELEIGCLMAAVRRETRAQRLTFGSGGVGSSTRRGGGSRSLFPASKSLFPPPLNPGKTKHLAPGCPVSFVGMSRTHGGSKTCESLCSFCGPWSDNCPGNWTWNLL